MALPMMLEPYTLPTDFYGQHVDTPAITVSWPHTLTCSTQADPGEDELLPPCSPQWQSFSGRTIC